MDGEIIPRSIVLERARKAAEQGAQLPEPAPWPIGTAAGRMFVQEFHAARALRKAAEAAKESVYA